MTTTDRTLSDLMDFGRVIQTIDGHAYPVEGRGLYTGPQTFDRAPEETQYVDLDADGGAPDPVAPDGWQYLTGWTGQYGYHGNTMHPSEFIGGALADHILATPGYYVAVTIDAWPLGLGDDYESGDAESIGWGILRYVGTGA